MDKETIKIEMFNALQKNGKVSPGNVIIPGILRSILMSKYNNYHIDSKELEIVGNELVNDGYYKVTNGFYAITSVGIIHFERLK